MSDALKILVVDDDPDIIEQLTFLLKAEGYQVAAAGGLEEAEQVLLTICPDLAIVDLMMEHMDGGFALSYRLKKRTPPVPVIMVTGVTSETGLDFGMAGADEKAWVKADAMLGKPVRFEQLQREIDRLLPR